MSKRTSYHRKVTADVKTFPIDREKFRAFCESVGHTETSLSQTYASGSFVSKRFNLYHGTFPLDFIEFCRKTYPNGKEKLEASIIPEEPEKKQEPEQMKMELPSVVKDKVITIQPVSVVGLNKLLEALNTIAERLAKLEEAWNGHHE